MAFPVHNILLCREGYGKVGGDTARPRATAWKTWIAGRNNLIRRWPEKARPRNYCDKDEKIVENLRGSRNASSANVSD
jgi:hypothetical protein